MIRHLSLKFRFNRLARTKMLPTEATEDFHGQRKRFRVDGVVGGQQRVAGLALGQVDQKILLATATIKCCYLNWAAVVALW